MKVKGYAAHKAKEALKSFSFERRSPGPKDVLLEIHFCGICHSDLHQARDEWGGGIFPMVPGHEIVGTVKEVGNQVKKFKVGDLAGVGCFVDSCKKCGSCKEGIEQYCTGHLALTYNGTEADEKTPTYGGYSSHIVVDENYTLKVPSNLDLAGVAPLLCAGITTYSPLRFCGVSKGDKVGVLGLGGLGHMAVKLAASFGAEVTVLSGSKSKEADAKKLGAQHFALTSNADQMTKLATHFDFIVDTVAAKHNLSEALGLLKRQGTLIMVGASHEPIDLNVFPLILQRRKMMGSLIGGIKETQEMLDYCSKHKITSDIELIKPNEINTAYERMLKGDVRYRFVMDTKAI